MELPNMHSSIGNRSQLFTLRFWYEERALDVREMRFQVRHVLTGETRYFRDWPAFQIYIISKLDAPDPTQR
jgi:hypothetical protein